MIYPVIASLLLITPGKALTEEVRFLKAKDCKPCHERQYKEWKESFHSKSLTTPTFRAMATIFYYNVKAKSPEQRKRWGENLEYCINCHAPQTRLTGNHKELAEQILKGEKVSSEGVTCTTCHSIKAVEDRPDPGVPVELDHPLVISYHEARRERLHKKSLLCSACHDYNNPHAVDLGDPAVVGVACCTVFRDWKETSFAKRGVTCQSCHMRDEMGVVEKASMFDRLKGWLFKLTNLERYVDDRNRVNHTMPGSHFENMLRKAVDMEITAQQSGGRIKATVRITNKTAHSIPNGCPPRSRIYLRFWAEDKDGDIIYSDTRKYGINLVDPQGFEPAMVDNSAGRHDFPLMAEETKEELFAFDLPEDSGDVELKATLTYILFVTPPPEAKDRMQRWIIKRIKAAKTREERDFILNKEIPDRMAAMNALESTFPPVVMAKASRRIKVRR